MKSCEFPWWNMTGLKVIVMVGKHHFLFLFLILYYLAGRTLHSFYVYLSFKQTQKKAVIGVVDAAVKSYKRNINIESNTLFKESRIMSHHNVIISSYRNLLDMWRLWHQRYCPHRQEYWMNSWLSTQYILFLLKD